MSIIETRSWSDDFSQDFGTYQLTITPSIGVIFRPILGGVAYDDDDEELVLLLLED